MSVLVEQGCSIEIFSLQLAPLDDNTLLLFFPDAHGFIIIITIQAHRLGDQHRFYPSNTGSEQAHDRSGEIVDSALFRSKLIGRDKSELKAVIPFPAVDVQGTHLLPVDILQGG